LTRTTTEFRSPANCTDSPRLGVYSINLHYRDDFHFFDEYGNWFHYQSSLNPDPSDGVSKDGRVTYDVFFAAAEKPKSVENKK
jgi:hypothetical protein